MSLKRINITLDEYTLNTLDTFAQPRSISRSQLIRLAVEEYVRNHSYQNPTPPNPYANVGTAHPVAPHVVKDERPLADKIMERVKQAGVKKGDMPFT